MPAREIFRRAAELQRLAHLLDCPPEDLACLAGLRRHELRELREASQRALLQPHQPVLRRAIQASKLLPVALLASISEHTLGPLLAARLAEQMNIHRLAAICHHVRPSHMAEVAQHMSPEKLCEMVLALPVPTLHEVAGELVQRREFIILGELVSLLPKSAIQPVLSRLHDAEALLRTCFFIEHGSRVQEMLEMLDEADLREIPRVAADHDRDLLPEALSLLLSLPPVWQRRLILLTMDCGQGTLSDLLQGIQRHRLWSIALPLVERLGNGERQQLMQLPEWEQETILQDMADSAGRHFLRPWVLLLVQAMPEATARKATAYLEGAGVAPERH